MVSSFALGFTAGVVAVFGQFQIIKASIERIAYYRGRNDAVQELSKWVGSPCFPPETVKKTGVQQNLRDVC